MRASARAGDGVSSSILPFFPRTSGTGTQGAELCIAAAGLTGRFNKEITFPADSKTPCVYIRGSPILRLYDFQILPQIFLIFLCQIRNQASPAYTFCFLCHIITFITSRTPQRSCRAAQSAKHLHHYEAAIRRRHLIPLP